MPRGSKDAYTDKQERQAEHIEDGYLDAGVPADEAAARAWATVNRQDHGGKKSGSGRGTSRDTKPTAKKPTAKKPTAKKPTAKKPTAKKTTAKKPTAKKPAAKTPTSKK